MARIKVTARDPKHARREAKYGALHVMTEIFRGELALLQLSVRVLLSRFEEARLLPVHLNKKEVCGSIECTLSQPLFPLV